jgi:hypothetical protein
MCARLAAAALLLGLAPLAQPAPVQASSAPEAEQVIAALLSAAEVDLRTVPGCAETVPADVASQARWSLAQDIARYLAEMGSGANKVTAECWPPDGGSHTCTVLLNHNAGELVWTRLYRFQLAPQNRVSALACLMIP